MADNVPKNHHPDKKLGEHCEDVQDTEAQALSSSSDATRALSQAHRESLMQRHGTLDLDPIPDPRDADPYNWPQWKVRNPSQYLATILTTYLRPETSQSHTRGHPRQHGHVHSRSNHPGLCEPRRGPGRLSPASVILDHHPNRHSCSGTIDPQTIR